MTATYVAWNGTPYPSPPPDGWYHASDGRWWAPGTGPNPPALATTEATDDLLADAAARSQAAAAGVVVPGVQRPSTPTETLGAKAVTTASTIADSPAPARRRATNGAETAIAGDTVAPETVAPDTVAPDTARAETDVRAELDNPTTMAEADGPQDTVLNRQRSDRSGSTTTDLPRSAPPEEPKADHGQDDARTPTPSKRKKPDLVLGTLVVVALIAAAVFGFLLLTSGNDSDQSDIATTNDPESTTATQAAATQATATTADAPTISVPASTTTAAPAAAATRAPASSTTLSADEQVALFRANLDANDLSSELLTPEDIVEFGNSFCTFAIISADAEAFDVYRQRALSESTGELTPEELSTAIDEALTIFCPQHAARLGVA